MKNMETTSPSKHDGRRTKAIDENSDSFSKIKMEEKVIKKLNHDICEITERITEKLSKRDYLESVLRRLISYRRCSPHKYRVEEKEKILRDLYMALDELNFMSNKTANGEWFVEKLAKNLHGSKSIAEEKMILRDIKIQQKEKDVASFKSLEVLKEMENVSNYESLKETIKDQIKVLCDYMESGTKVKYGVKELDAINGEIYSLRAKLREKYNKKDEAYQRILKLKKMVSCNE
ncbi:uncharacterized protein LOC123898411 isoform X2 [Trifolium pratense]|uniref:uncharacterized protein LOC123898411 isoform X2 n=1 Tax=Trifolium pratense TaxID=57577 RepID=UPI001E692273|nr:uncharacterized protein LOC123898411 isoform X2 [Trifolium pratense]